MSFGTRLKSARVMQSMTQAELAEKVSVEKMSISKYENDRMLPSAKTMILLAEALHVSLDYFINEKLEVKLESEPVFRMDSKEKTVPGYEIDRVKAQMEKELAPYQEILTIYGDAADFQKNESLRVFVHSNRDIEAVAKRVRAQWNLGDVPISNLIETVELNGFKILSIDKPSENCKEKYEAVSFLNEKSGPVIGLCPSSSRKRQRFSLAHELGHYFLRNPEKSKVEGKWDPETRANTFAAALLMPEDDFRKTVGTVRPSFFADELHSYSERYGVSAPSILFRMKNLQIINEEQYAKLKKAITVQTPVKKILREKDKTTEKPAMMKNYVFQALTKGMISERKAGELLGIDIDMSTILRGTI